MKLYNSIGPNPQLVRVFAAEKGISLELVPVDLMKGENRQDGHLGRNPAGQTPALELDNGQYVSEITAICEYLEEKNPKPALIGSTPEERAETRMWVRRMDENVIVPGLSGFRYAEGQQLFTGRIPVYPEAAPHLKNLAQDRILWLENMVKGRTWFCGERFSLADLMAGVFFGFMEQVGQKLPEGAKTIASIVNRVKERPSFKA